MGKKIPFDTAQELAKTIQEQEISIYAKHNKYAYKVNINHPSVRPLYERYKEKVGERILSDKQRLDFEQLFFKMIEKQNTRNEKSL